MSHQRCVCHLQETLSIFYSEFLGGNVASERDWEENDEKSDGVWVKNLLRLWTTAGTLPAAQVGWSNTWDNSI